MSDTNNGAATGDTNNTATNGRDSEGRFAAGNRGGPGNPFARHTAAMRKAIAEAVTAEDLAAIAAALLKKAREGDVAAAKLVFSYAAGRPAPAPDPDTLDAHELAVRRSGTATPEDMKALFERCPAWLLCAIASVAAPQVHEHLQTAFAQGVRRQGEVDVKGGRAAPEIPGPYHGRMKADWAPSWLRLGISDEVMNLFMECPAWMPDYFNTDREPFAYADVLRSVRHSLLDALPKSDATPRHSATSADTKRDKRTGAPTARPGPDSGRARSRAT
jgi:hypothetical protein